MWAPADCCGLLPPGDGLCDLKFGPPRLPREFLLLRFICVCLVLFFFLKMEILRNSTENNFECEICEKSFQTNQKMNQHIKLVHGKTNLFSCNDAMCVTGYLRQKVD